MDFGQDNAQYGTIEDDHDKHSYTQPQSRDTGGSSESYGTYSTGSAEPEAVDVYREMMETPGIDEDHAEFLETRIEDLLES